MSHAKTADTSSPHVDDGVLMRLVALALDKVQRRRRRPKKNRRLHRV